MSIFSKETLEKWEANGDMIPYVGMKFIDTAWEENIIEIVKIRGNGHDYKLKYIICNDKWDRLEVPTETIHTLSHIQYIYI